MLVERRARLILLIKSAITPSEIGSRPVNGSSYSISAGSRAMVRARATRRDMPPDSSSGIRFSVPCRPTALSFRRTKSRMISSGKSVCSRSGKATFSYTDKSVNSAPNWNSTPILRRCWCSSLALNAARSRPLISTRPAVGAIWPVIRRSRVVLPLPEPPITAANVPWAT